MISYWVFIFILVKLFFFETSQLFAQKKDIVSLNIQTTPVGIALFKTHSDNRHWKSGGFVFGLSAAIHMQKRDCSFSYQAGIGTNLINFSFALKEKEYKTRFHNYPNLFISTKYLFNKSNKYIFYSQLSFGLQLPTKKFKSEDYKDEFKANTTYSNNKMGLFLSPEIGCKLKGKNIANGIEVGLIYRLGFNQFAKNTLTKDNITQLYFYQGNFLGFSFRYFFTLKVKTTQYSPSYFRKARCPKQ